MNSMVVHRKKGTVYIRLIRIEQRLRSIAGISKALGGSFGLWYLVFGIWNGGA